MRTTNFTLSWQRCQGPPPTWCSLLNLNLDDSHFENLEGVYVIWHGGLQPRWVRVGQGIIRDRLAAHRRDPRITFHRRLGLYVSWATVNTIYRNGIERYLAENLRPLVGDRYPDVRPIAVNLPGQQEAP